jgi:hypothetical protein
MMARSVSAVVVVAALAAAGLAVAATVRPQAMVLQKSDVPAGSRVVGPRLTGAKAALEGLPRAIIDPAARRAMTRSAHYQVGWRLRNKTEVASSAYVLASAAAAHSAFKALAAGPINMPFRRIKGAKLGQEQWLGTLRAGGRNVVLIARTGRVIWSVSTILTGGRATATLPRETIALARKQRARVRG